MERDFSPLFVFFASQVKRLREAKGWSQEALGKRIGYSGEMVSKVETGKNRPSPEVLIPAEEDCPVFRCPHDGLKPPKSRSNLRM